MDVVIWFSVAWFLGSVATLAVYRFAFTVAHPIVPTLVDVEFAAIVERLADVDDIGNRIAASDLYLVPSLMDGAR